MIFNETELTGAYIIDIEPMKDDRGFFARSWCQKEFEERGLNSNLVQCNISYNEKRGTLRGMHFQLAPFEEEKLVRCVHGSIYDVIVDLREESSTYKQWVGVVLSAENRRSLFVPKGFAHGFLTLSDNAEVFYQMSSEFVAGSDKGLRWDDPAIAISWPNKPQCISVKDQAYKDLYCE